MKIRTFLAVALADEISTSAEKLIHALASGGQGVKWVGPGDMHLTLKFFGEIDERETYAISKTVEKSVRSWQPFQIHVEGLGAFPDMQRPRTVWVGVTTGGDELCRLQAEIDAALGDLGYPRERRKFHAHLTLGRVRAAAGKRDLISTLRKVQKHTCGVANVDSVVFFRSELHRSGPVYTKLATCFLGTT